MAHLRFARPVRDLARSKDLNCRGLGLRVVGSITEHDGFDRVVLGVSGGECHLEFTHCRAPTSNHPA
jgi:hypothetical protein